MSQIPTPDPKMRKRQSPRRYDIFNLIKIGNILADESREVDYEKTPIRKRLHKALIWSGNSEEIELSKAIHRCEEFLIGNYTKKG